MASLQSLEVLQRQAAAIQGEILAEVASRGVMAEFGHGTLAVLVRNTLRIDKGEATRRVARATGCNRVRSGTGEVAALAPQSGVALREGAIGTAHADAVRETLAEMPGTVAEQDRRESEATLVNLARVSTPAKVRKAGRRILAYVQPDGTSPGGDDPARPARELRLGWRRDGRLGLVGVLDAEAGQALEAALSPLAKPRPSSEHGLDEREPAQRYGDALAELADHSLRAGTLPSEGGERPRIVVTIGLRELSSDGAPTATGLLNQDVPTSAEQARRLACDAGVIPAVLGSKGEVLDLGREQRLVSTAQRRALALRDRGCVFPGCDRPEGWCHAHHIEHWAHGGPTDLANLALLCGEHHRIIHHSEWNIHMGSGGIPVCIPPPWIHIPRQREGPMTRAPAAAIPDG
ncbi:DUF222 domain-containing protein [Haloechinothrix sp. YIM 98757]|uniref:DUF222 domain-containing protein n=1 Tax=Haloechinothrix aidingensis TaxID=2752311 RepID=A0A837ZUR1_9PSEU|nr:HNH endonuclease signature motif containing protein [Haloechinothrix aidingensis]MBA0124336.1 DUF222 domain-containing protein [Haloechinothrix aidingensis]